MRAFLSGRFSRPGEDQLSLAIAAHLLEARAAINGLVAAWQKRDERILAAARADCRMHLTLRAFAAEAGTSRAEARAFRTDASLSVRPASGTAAWRVHQSPAGEELLLPRGEHELGSTVFATKNPIFIG